MGGEAFGELSRAGFGIGWGMGVELAEVDDLLGEAVGLGGGGRGVD